MLLAEETITVVAHWNVKLKDLIEETFNENICRVYEF